MSAALEIPFSAYRAHSFNPDTETKATAAWPRELRGSCIRGIVWALVFEAGGMLTLVLLTFCWRALGL